MTNCKSVSNQRFNHSRESNFNGSDSS